MGISLYSSRLILEALGVEDFGLYNVVGGIVVVLSFLNGALSAATSRFLTYELGKNNQQTLNCIFSASLNLHLCISILVFFVGETIGLWFLYNRLNIPVNRLNAAFWVYQISLANAMVVLTQVPYNASIISHEKMSIFAYISIADSLFKLLAINILPLFSIDRLILYAFLLFCISSLGMVFYRFYCRKKFVECRFRLIRDNKLYFRLLSYSGWDLFGNFAVVCQGQGLNIVLNMFCGPAVNAARAIAYQVYGAVNMFVNNFSLAARPQIIKLYAEKRVDAMYELMFYTSKYGFFLMLLIILPIYFGLPSILRIWLNEVPDYTLTFTKIILISSIFRVFGSSMLSVYHAIGRIKLGNVLNGSLMISVLPISYILLYMNYPPQYVFVVLVSINICTTIIGLLIIHWYEHFSLRRYIKQVLAPDMLIFIIGLVAPIMVREIIGIESFLNVVLLSIITDIWIVLLIYVIGINASERKKLIEIIKRKMYGNR
jgi:O-antigen/teichoic acid export membrane protein